MSNVIAINSRQEVLNNLGDYGEAHFNVQSLPMFYEVYPEETSTLTKEYIVPNKKTLVRSDNNESIAVVSDGYEVAQHPDAFRTVENIITNSNLDLTNVKRNIETSHNGARAYARYTFPAHEIETSRGDSSTLEIVARNSFDGSWCFHIDIGAVRGLCLNGQVFIEDFAMYKSKHTKGLNMSHASRKLSKSLEVYEKEVERWKEWKNIQLTSLESLNIFGKISNCKYLNSQDSNSLSTSQLLDQPEVYRNKTLMNLFNHYVTDERKALGSNLWAVYNTLTHWATHAPAGKKTAQNNISAIKVRRQDKVREVFKGLAIAA